MANSKRKTQKRNFKISTPTPLRKPPRLKGKVAKRGIKPIRKKAKK